MDWLNAKYLSQVSARLPRYTKRNNAHNFRCPFCGDSTKSKSKARGWIYHKQNKTSFHCYNCGLSLSFNSFLEKLDPILYQEYRLEKIREFGKREPTPEMVDMKQFVDKMRKPQFLTGPFGDLKKVSQLASNHPVKQYVVGRHIPTTYHHKLFWCRGFASFTNQFLPGKFSEKAVERDEPRLIIPFFEKEKKIHAYQGRSLDPRSQVKYITIVLDETIPKVYGLDTVSFKKQVYVLEGPIDSMFVDNGIATAGGDLAIALRGAPKELLTIVYDNEPRSRETVAKMEKAINEGYSVCFWPEKIQQKDVNSMVSDGGYSPESIKYIINANTYTGLRAKLKFASWKKT